MITSILDWLGSGMKYLASFHKFFLDAIAIKDKFGIRVEGTKLNLFWFPSVREVVSRILLVVG